MKRAPTTPPDLSGFHYLRHLGGGGFADVFEYEDTLGRHVAVKVLLSGLGRDRQLAFEDEARRMAQLSNHPSIVSIHQAGAAPDGRPFLVMEYCPPPELWHRVRERPLSVAKTLEIGVQVAGAVESAHRLDILHRDIKPANILFTEFGHPALTDFGIAASTLAGQSGEAEGLSVPWAPPEQLTSGAPMGASGDVYALAATLWTCLVGRHPFYLAGGPNDSFTLSKRIKHDQVPRTGRQDVPESLERVLAIAMDKRQEARYRTARDFALALQGIQAELHLPITANDIRERTVPVDVVREEDDGHTKIRAIIPIDPDGFGSRARGSSIGVDPRVDRDAPGSGRAGGLVMTSPDVDTDRRVLTDDGVHTVLGNATSDRTVLHDRSATGASPTGAAPTRSGQGRDDGVAGEVADSSGRGGGALRRKAAVVAVVVVVAGGAVAVANLINTPKPEPGPTRRPSDPVADLVPPPTGTVTRGSGTQVVVSLRHADPKPGDVFVYRLIDPANPRSYTPTIQQTFTVTAPPGKACVEVLVRRSTGRSSDTTALCTGA